MESFFDDIIQPEYLSFTDDETPQEYNKMSDVAVGIKIMSCA